MKVLHVMTPQVISISPEKSILDAIELMLNNHISGLPVVDKNEKLIGIVSEGDFLRREEIDTDTKRNRWLNFLLGPSRLAIEYARTHGRKVAEIMTLSPITVSETTSLDEVAGLMERHHIKQLPVTRDGKLVGLVTRANLIQAIAARGHAIPSLSETDQSIRTNILGEIAKQPWATTQMINVSVHEGIVELFGVTTNDRQGGALKVLVENTQGVKGIKNDMALMKF